MAYKHVEADNTCSVELPVSHRRSATDVAVSVSLLTIPQPIPVGLLRRAERVQAGTDLLDQQLAILIRLAEMGVF